MLKRGRLKRPQLVFIILTRSFHSLVNRVILYSLYTKTVNEKERHPLLGLGDVCIKLSSMTPTPPSTTSQACGTSCFDLEISLSRTCMKRKKKLAVCSFPSAKLSQRIRAGFSEFGSFSLFQIIKKEKHASKQTNLYLLSNFCLDRLFLRVRSPDLA